MPTTLKQFLGLASYYRRYIKKFADIATPLHSLSKKDVPFAWTPECNNTFSELKDKLTHAPKLSFPQFSPDVFPLIPPLLQQQFLYQTHDIPSAGHQGYLKTLTHLKQEGYWPGMANDVQCYCQECNTCQKSKLSSATRAPLVNIPILNP